MALTETAHPPLCTYRVQLQPKFTFADLLRLLPYFRELGIADFYLSPIFMATPGSQHGYDVTDYRQVNPELGGREAFDRLAERVHRGGGRLLLDFVPNHMGIAGLVNHWWRGVLEHGRFSAYAEFFDIKWKDEANLTRPRVLVPVLADRYGKVLEEGKISLDYDEGFVIRYGDLCLPLNPRSYAAVLAPLGRRRRPGPSPRRALAALIGAFASLPTQPVAADPAGFRAIAVRVDRLKGKLAALLTRQPQLRAQLTARLQRLNGVPGEARSFDALHAILEDQHYRLSHWQTGAHEINYRRFFAIDSLVGLHIEKPEVFRECHELVARLVRAGQIDGLRIDHIDGLQQPENYLRRLQALKRPDPARPLYVLVEKILARDEELPESWPTHGTTGYEFIGQLAGVFVASDGEARFDDLYRRVTGDLPSYADTVYEKKRMIVGEMFVNAVSNLGAELTEVLSADRHWRDLTRHELTTAVSELMTNLAVYRTYRTTEAPVSPHDRAQIMAACTRAIARNPRADPTPFEFVRDLIVGDYPPPDAPPEYRETLLNWVLTFQQYTGAVMAKSVEDTAFYTYNRLIALNEVGGDPGHFGDPLSRFHEANAARLRQSPLGLLATSTHDTKLSEDVRARLYALSELADEWEGWLAAWTRLTVRHTTSVEGQTAPDAVDLYRFFQVLLGAWPLAEADVDDAFRARLREHFRKAVSEAKRHTSILQSNPAYFEACDRFVDGITHPATGAAFLDSFRPCAQRIARLGLVNSLAQLVLKCTVPGVPDFYQGNEIWDFSLVDPDNRREVDYERRRRLLRAGSHRSPATLMKTWRSGGIKLRVLQILLHYRARHPELFLRGAYEAVPVEGGFAHRVIAFRRHLGAEAMLVAVPRLTARLGSPPLSLAWDDTCLPAGPAGRPWRELFTGRTFPPDKPVFLRALFAELPFAVLTAGGPRRAAPAPP